MLTVSGDMHVWHHKRSQLDRSECVCAYVMCLALVSTVRYIPTSRHRSSRVSGQARLPKPRAYLQLVLLLLDVPHTGYMSDTHGRLSDLIDANPRFVRPELC